MVWDLVLLGQDLFIELQEFQTVVHPYALYGDPTTHAFKGYTS